MEKYIACKIQEHICEEIRKFSSLKKNFYVLHIIFYLSKQSSPYFPGQYPINYDL